MIRQEVASCSGLGDVAFTWMLECESEATTFASLAFSAKKLESLDCKLASALVKSCDKTLLAQEITRATEAEAKAGRNIKGRQILFHLL